MRISDWSSDVCSSDLDNTVKVPDGFPDFWKAYAEAGWIGIMQKPEYGGAGLPYTLGKVIEELLCSANVAFALYPGLTQGCRSEEHTSELQSLMRISYAVFCLKKKIRQTSSDYTTYILST